LLGLQEFHHKKVSFAWYGTTEPQLWLDLLPPGIAIHYLFADKGRWLFLGDQPREWAAAAVQ
jgi:hypothetical protein